jgi:hypothetical protein
VERVSVGRIPCNLLEAEILVLAGTIEHHVAERRPDLLVSARGIQPVPIAPASFRSCDGMIVAMYLPIFDMMNAVGG